MSCGAGQEMIYCLFLQLLVRLEARIVCCADLTHDNTVFSWWFNNNNLIVSGLHCSSLDLSSSFLPDSLPDGDPSEFAYPVFLQEPKNTFASKETPGTLSCKVAHAKEVYFTCDGEKMKTGKEVEGVDEATKSKYKEINITIRKSQVLDTLHKYYCICHAASAQHEVQSREALVDLACEYCDLHIHDCLLFN